MESSNYKAKAKEKYRLVNVLTSTALLCLLTAAPMYAANKQSHSLPFCKTSTEVSTFLLKSSSETVLNRVRKRFKQAYLCEYDRETRIWVYQTTRTPVRRVDGVIRSTLTPGNSGLPQPWMYKEISEVSGLSKEYIEVIRGK